MNDITALMATMKAAAEKASNDDWVKESGDGWEATCSANDQANGGFIIAHFEGPDAGANREFVQVANPANVKMLVEALEKAQTERDEFRNRLKLERSILEDADNRITEQARIINLLNEHGYEVHDHEINESNVFDAVELLLSQLIEAQETPSEYELVRGQLLIAHRTLLNQRAKIAELESRTVTVKLPEEAVDQVCLAAAEIHNLGNGVSDDKAQFIINRIRNYLENGGELNAAGIQVIEGEQKNG